MIHYRVVKMDGDSKLCCVNFQTSKWTKLKPESTGKAFRRKEKCEQELAKIQDKEPGAFIEEFDWDISHLLQSSTRRALDDDAPTSAPEVVREEVHPDLSNLPDDPMVDPDYLFQKLNDICIKCANACKQSWQATIVYCPQFRYVEGGPTSVVRETAA